VLITPWNLYNNPDVIRYTLETLGAFIGPLFGVLIADYYLVRRQRIVVADLFSMSSEGRYWYRKGYNPPAIIATVLGAALAMVPVIWVDGPGMTTVAQYSWFIGVGVALACYRLLAVRMGVTARSTLPVTA